MKNYIANWKEAILRRRERLFQLEAEEAIKVEYRDRQLYVTYYGNIVARIVSDELASQKQRNCCVSLSELTEYIDYLRNDFVANHKKLIQ